MIPPPRLPTSIEVVLIDVCAADAAFAVRQPIRKTVADGIFDVLV